MTFHVYHTNRSLSGNGTIQAGQEALKPVIIDAVDESTARYKFESKRGKETEEA